MLYIIFYFTLAQFWGVAQRRRRIFLVADFGGTTAAEILFKQDRLPGDSAACRDPGERASPTAQRGTDDTGRACLTPWDVQSRRIFTDAGAWPALYGGEGGGHGYIKTEERPKKPLVCLNDQGGQRMEVTEEIVSTLRASMGGHQPLIFDNHGQDSRFTGPAAVSQTVSAGFGMGGNNQPLILLEDHKSDEPESGLKQKCDDSSEKTFCIAGNTIDRKSHNGGNGLGCQTDIAYTLTAADHHAVFHRQGFAAFSEGQVTGTQCARQYKGNSHLVSTYQEVVGALCSGDEKGIGNQYVSQNKCILEKKNLIRRLTPMECERLQGFPDGWTLIPGASDSARYKALGNSVAIPCVEFLMHGIAFFLSEY